MSCASSGHITKLKQSIICAFRYLWVKLSDLNQNDFKNGFNFGFINTVSINKIVPKK